MSNKYQGLSEAYLASCIMLALMTNMSKMLTNSKNRIIALALASVLATSTFALTAYANPPGIPQEMKKAWKINLHGTPDGWGPNPCGSNVNVYMERGDAHDHMNFILDAGHSPHIVDCMTESIDGDPALVHADEAAKYTVAVRIEGKMDGNLKICRNTFEAHAVDPEGHEFTADFCTLGFIDLTKNGKESFSVFGAKLFDDALAGEVWSLSANGDFRIAQIWFLVPK